MTYFPRFQSSFHLLILLLAWLLLSFTTLVFGRNQNNNNMQCIEQEKQALLQFKQRILVDHCGLLSSWTDREEHRDCCKWRGVHCSNQTSHVIMLNLRGVMTDYPVDRCLEGEVGPSLLDLKHLKYLDLSLNSFQGQLPSFLGSLVTLNHLNLSNAGFGGEVPSQLGNLSSLTHLDLNSDVNGLYIKSLWWLSRLASLIYIDLSGIDLSQATDWLQVGNNLPFLRVLHMDGCGLSLTTPPSLSYINSSTTLGFLSLSDNSFNNALIFQWLFNMSGLNTHLEYIDLSENYIPGPIISAFGNMGALSYLDLSENDFEGPIPSAFGDMDALSYLDLSYNQLQGPIPSSFVNMYALSYLDLSYNQIEGPFPKNLANSCNLETLRLERNNVDDELSIIIKALSGCPLDVLNLDQNQVWGSIPDTFSTFSSLRTLRLNGNQLNGTISPNLGQLSMLGQLDLSSNSLKGTLSNVHLANLSRLSYLDLSDNPALVANFSADWIPPFQLETVVLKSCKLGPYFPKWLQSQKKLSWVDISNAKISDTIPYLFWKSLPSQLQYLNMSHNNIHGKLPDLSSLSFDQHYYLDVDMSFNYIEGSIPSFPMNINSLFLHNNMFSDATPLLCPNTNMFLSVLFLSNNLLSGELPDCWMYFDRLSILLLENNRYSGTIPPSIGNLKQLQWLQLRNNSFSGELPEALENCTSLVRLNVGYNSFTGYIPTGIGDTYANLSFLSLRSNNFVGGIPLSICRLSFLQILDLSINNISGTIPECIYNLTAMTTSSSTGPSYDIFLRHIDATIIMWKRKEQSFGNTLELVKYIHISNNNLEGQIPIGISSLAGLVSLDLSRNNLSGSIPYKVGQLKALEFLDLSYNHLSGEIPTSLATLSSLEMLDLSNNNLSGKIPVGTQLQSFDATAYQGNPGLCGDPLPKCPGDQATHDIPGGENVATQQHDNDSDSIFPGLYISIVLGFIIGFWGVCGTLIIKRSWRQAFYRFFDDMARIQRTS